MIKNWIDNIVNLLNGRIHNSIMSLHHRLEKQENELMNTRDALNNINAELSGVANELDTGIAALEAKINALPGVQPEDFSAELAQLQATSDRLKASADSINTVPTDLPANPASDTGGQTAGPIDHGDNVPTSLAGSSGPTDAGATTEIPQPGTNPPAVPTDTPTVPTLEDMPTPEAPDTSVPTPAPSTPETGDASGTGTDQPTGDGEV